MTPVYVHFDTWNPLLQEAHLNTSNQFLLKQHMKALEDLHPSSIEKSSDETLTDLQSRQQPVLSNTVCPFLPSLQSKPLQCLWTDVDEAQLNEEVPEGLPPSRRNKPNERQWHSILRTVCKCNWLPWSSKVTQKLVRP